MRIANLLVCMVVLACGEGKSEDSKKKTGPTPPEHSPAETTSSKQPVELDGEALCRELLSPAQVGAILGEEGLTPGSVAGSSSGLGKCDLMKGAHYRARLVVDCRASAGVTDVALQRKTAKMTAGKGPYRDIELGKGGGYAHTKVGLSTVHSVDFVHASTPCAVSVSTHGIEENQVEKLAEHVAKKLTTANHPR